MRIEAEGLGDWEHRSPLVVQSDRTFGKNYYVATI